MILGCVLTYVITKMPQSRRSPVTTPVIDDYPVRPVNIVKQEEVNSPKKPEEEKRILVLFSLIYFLYGSGISIYGLLYPKQARKTGLNPCIYGSVLAVSHFMCILAYPIACRIELGYEVPFYIIGGLTAISFILTATMLPEPDPSVSYIDMPVIYWLKDRRMLIYFFIMFATFNYVGFLCVSIELLLKQFHLNSLYTGLMFSISPFVYGLAFPGWTWFIRKGCNNVMLIFIGSITIFASLVLLGPAPYTSLEGSLSYVCCALVLEGLGIACKSACVLDASEKDLRHQEKYTKIQQQLVIPTIFILGASLGYFSGSLTAGFTDYYIGYRNATLPLFGLEICIAITAIIFALNRNYVSRKRRGNTEEQEPILRS